MRKQLRSPLLGAMLLFSCFAARAQNINDNGQQSTVLATGSYQDFTLPNNPQITKISFYLVGADGGAAICKVGQYVPFVGFGTLHTYSSGGGAGATLAVTFLVGSGPGKIPLGSTIRFVVGKKGQTGTAEIDVVPDGGTGAEWGGGGGGTAVLFRPPSVAGSSWTFDWHLLAVAGGGGGAYQGVVAGVALGLGSDGGAGREGESGGDGGGIVLSGEGGEDGNGGGYGGLNGGAGGGGAFEDGHAVNSCIYPWEESNPSAGEGGMGGTLGGYGGTDEGCANLFDISNGGYGFGGGGIGAFHSGGGGGGYSGGGAGGQSGGGGGGGSYYNPIWVEVQPSHGTHTDNPNDGSVKYQVTLNRPPVANCKTATLSLDASGAVTLDAASINNGSTDPDGDDLTYSLSKSNFNCSNVGANTVTLTVTDIYGATATCNATVNIVDNSAPTVLTKNINAYLDAAGQVTITAAQVDNGSSDNCGIQTRQLNISSFNCSNIGPNTITLTVTDVNSNSAGATAVVTVIDNLPPVITNVTPDKSFLWAPDNKMVPVNIAITSVENCPGTGVTTCQVVGITSNEIDNDGVADWEITGNNSVRLRAERWGTGTGRVYTITVRCTDGSGNFSEATTTVLVAHNITAPKSGTPFKIGSNVNFAGEFWDLPGKLHTAKWVIDGSTIVKGQLTEPAPNKNGKVTGSYKFTTAGVYKLQMNVTDNQGVTTSSNTNGDLDEIVVIYDPNGGFTYGGGNYFSSPGSLKSNLAAAGKVSYGYTVNYYKTATNPKGEMQFKFDDFEFNAVNFEYMVVTGSKAQIKGTGKITGGQSGVSFILTVIDGDLDGSITDKIRMKIYNKNTNEIYYDNQGGSDASTPVTVVGNNSSIVIQGIDNGNAASRGEVLTIEENREQGFDVSVSPNPSHSNFDLQVMSTNTAERIVMRVTDLFGRLIETRTVSPQQKILLGARYLPGIYHVTVIQGREQKLVKLVKF